MLLNDRVLPCFEEHQIALLRVLTDRGTEYFGTDSHEYELYLAVEDIDHTRTKPKSPQTNGACERPHKNNGPITRCRSGSAINWSVRDTRRIANNLLLKLVSHHLQSDLIFVPESRLLQLVQIWP
jgi:hypothetical protein